jgi:hypothetical protein
LLDRRVIGNVNLDDLPTVESDERFERTPQIEIAPTRFGRDVAGAGSKAVLIGIFAISRG